MSVCVHVCACTCERERENERDITLNGERNSSTVSSEGARFRGNPSR